jgi:hypothetical protein
LTTAGGLLLLWLASIVPASAAPARFAAAGPTCDPQTLTLRKLARLPRSFGGPLRPPRPIHLVGLTDPSARRQRRSRSNLDREQAVIQNDAPAARIDDDPRELPSLRPLELLTRAIDVRPRSPPRSPAAPRGPPLAV